MCDLPADRTDVVPGGDATALQDSVTRRLFTLPMSTLVYPAHDYAGFTTSTIGEEKAFATRAQQVDDDATSLADASVDEKVEAMVIEARRMARAAMSAAADANSAPPKPSPADVAANLKFNMAAGRPASVEAEANSAIE